MNVVAVGECMIEISRLGGDEGGGTGWRLQHGGDTLNVATYLARLGTPVAYMTALGADSFSQAMRGAWTAEGIDTRLVLTHAQRLPGLYAIETDAAGERRFHYWRDQSAARALFDCEGIDGALAAAATASLLYLSGITLSLFGADGQARLLALCRAVRAGGGRVAFDTNYRPRGWASADAARAAIAAIMPLVDLALPTFDDEAALWGDAAPAACLARWQAAGVADVAIKLGPQGAMILEDGASNVVPVRVEASPRDTTGAGDSFNAAYIAARLDGLPPRLAAQHGNRLAAEVVRHPGAIMPAAMMPGNERLA